MTIGLGIDTGGTYTDAVLLDYGSGQVLAAAKALTTWPDLAQGIGEAVDEVLRQRPGPVHLVALSTTLATNALVEGRGSPAALLCIGYDPDLIDRWGFRKDLATPHVAFIPGGHRADGSEARPLDRDALRRAVRQFADQVEAFAVSGYFAVRNPAHELAARETIQAETGKPVTCGHELTTRLNAIRRATTAALNARLIPLLQDLILAVQETLR
ncbi:MAG: hydantoinase/oxoprolinase family protein, partial [Anaerolineae bacterium]|nr:hydantoinase/oxoprolinase family protein [Anaerolineae bacterium]